MVSLEFEKPSQWTIGKKLGVLAIFCLLIGAFLSYSICTPILTIFMLIFLFYMKFDIYLEKGDETRVKINHFILIIWSAWYLLFHLIYIISFLRIMEEFGDDVFRIPTSFLIGAGLASTGFVLCIISGILEWKFPSKEGKKIGLPKRKEKEVVVEGPPEPTPEVVSNVEPKKIPVVPAVKSGAPREEPIVEPKPAPVTTAASQKTEPVAQEPTSEEEKALRRWARHINRYNQTFELCLKCNNYTFINAKDTGDSILFKCPECEVSFTLKK
jgi:hypothetical protein